MTIFNSPPSPMLHLPSLVPGVAGWGSWGHCAMGSWHGAPHLAALWCCQLWGGLKARRKSGWCYFKMRTYIYIYSIYETTTLIKHVRWHISIGCQAHRFFFYSLYSWFENGTNGLEPDVWPCLIWVKYGMHHGMTSGFSISRIRYNHHGLFENWYPNMYYLSLSSNMDWVNPIYPSFCCFMLLVLYTSLVG